MAWPAKKHGDENAHETHRIMPRRWGEVLVPTHPIFGFGRKRLPHTCICVCVCVPVRIPAHAHDCIRSHHLFPSFDTCLAELEHRVLLSIVSCSHHTESNMYAGRIQYVGVHVLPLLLTMLDDKTYCCDMFCKVVAVEQHAHACMVLVSPCLKKIMSLVFNF